MSDKPVFVIIDTKGRAENLGETYTDWHDILGYVHRVVMSAGGNSALPDKLLLNGEIVAVDLHQTGWEYGRRRQKAIDDAIAAFVEKYPRPWKKA